jgi:serine/threonine-protein kinase
MRLDMRQAVQTAVVGSNSGRFGATGATGATRVGHGTARATTVDGTERTADDAEVAHRLPFGPVDLVGEGGMALVYRGYDPERGCPVAVKVLRAALVGHAEIVAAFAAEHRMVSRIAHPGVVAVHAAGDVDGVPYLVMDWCDGQTLADLVAFEPMALRRAAAVGAQLASALDAAHQAGVIHCDVKPENVIISRRTGEARLLDFGVARLIDDASTPSDLVCGTPSYMAPEQWQGAATPASDIYALGCVLFELVTGAPPFHGSFAEVMAGHQHDEPPSLDELRPDLAAPFANLITSMLAKDPDQRPSSMAVVAARLASLAARPPRTVAARHALPARRAAVRASQVELVALAG